MNKKDWIAQATDPLDYAVRKLGANVSLKALETEAKAAMAAGLFPGQGLWPTQQQIDARRKMQADSTVNLKDSKEETKQASSIGVWNPKTQEWEKGVSETLTPEEQQPSLPTVGVFNKETKKWEKAISESELSEKLRGEHVGTVGAWNPRTKKWVA